MHCHRISLALFAALLTASCSQAIAAEEDDSAVFLATVSPCEGEPEVLLAATLNTDIGQESPEREAARLSLDREYSQALKNMRARNSGSVPLPKGFECSRFKITSFSAIGSERSIHWETVHRSFPGITKVREVSLPGYNLKGDRAIVEITMTCGLLCGSDELVELRKANGKWERVNFVVSANT